MQVRATRGASATASTSHDQLRCHLQTQMRSCSRRADESVGDEQLAGSAEWKGDARPIQRRVILPFESARV